MACCAIVDIDLLSLSFAFVGTGLRDRIIHSAFATVGAFAHAHVRIDLHRIRSRSVVYLLS